MKLNRLAVRLSFILVMLLLPAACRQQPEPTPVAPPPADITASVETPAAAPTPTIAPTATTPPWPSQVDAEVSNPALLESFSPQAPLAIQFNQPMDTSSVNLPLLISPFVEGSFSWNSDATRLTFLPKQAFTPGGAYTVVLDNQLVSASGKALAQSRQWALQVAAAPQILKRSPRDLSLAERRPEIRLTFSQKMDQTSVVEALTVTPAVPFQTIWEDDTLIIRLEEALAPGTRYHFTLGQAAADQHGIALADNYRWTYRPKALISQTDTPDNEHREDPIRIQFNYPMDGQSVSRAIQFTPAIIGDLSWSDDLKTAVFNPAEPLPADTDFTLSFNAPLIDAAGDPMPTPEAINFASPSAVLSATPSGSDIHPAITVRITFDRLVDEASAEEAFSIEPPIAGQISWRETTLIFAPESGYLDQYTDYTVTMDTSVAGLGGEPLFTKPYSWTFHTGRLQNIATFGWGPNAQVVDVDGRRAIQYQLYQTEVNDLTFELYRLNLEQFLDRYASGFRGVAGWETNRPISTDGPVLIKSWTQAVLPSPVRYTNIQELIIPEDVRPGLYMLNMKAGFLNDQLILLLTRNTITVKQAGDQIVAWVTDINGGPVPGLSVEVYARDGERLAGGTTADNGVFRTQVDRDPEPLIVIARQAEDVTASGLSNEWRTNSSWMGWWRPESESVHYAAYIYTDRPIYRPGQQMFFKGIIRSDDDAILDIIPEGTAVTARIRDARNNVVQTFEMTTNSFGTINGSFQIGDGAMLGEYAVELELEGEAYRQVFKVEDYRKPDYKVAVETDAQRYVNGDIIEITVDSAYFFGEPVPNASIVVNLFHLGERYWWDENSDADYIWLQTYEPIGRGRTDADGRFTFSFSTRDKGYQQQPVDWRSSLTRGLLAIEATVDDGSHQTVSGFATVQLYNAAEGLKVDTSGFAHQPGETFSVSAELMDIFGRPVSGRSLELTLRRWSLTNYSYDTILQSHQLTTDDSGRASMDIAASQPGYYQLRVAGTDRLGNSIEYNTYLFVFSDFYSSWYGRDSALNIDSEQAQYAPGDDARLLIESQFSGPALLTVERGTTRREQLIQLTAPVTIIELPIQPQDAPNIHVTVNAWQEQDTRLREDMWSSLPDSRLHMASVNVSVPVTGKRLQVTITPDQETYAPRQEATFTVRVTNQAGTPVSAELSLAMVDEAIFALSDDLSGDIFDTFYHERDNLVKTFDALSPVRYLGGGGGGGGGGDLAGNPRADFPDTAEWFPVLHTDYKGEATVSVTLPDNLTSWRLTAKAATADTQVGEAVANIVTRQDIIVRPILPRTLTSGDQLNLSAVVHNYSPDSQRIELRLQVDPDLLAAQADQLAQTITLASGQQRLVGWSLDALAAGEARITIQASVSGVIQDAVQLPLAIRPLSVPDVTSQAGQFTGQLATTIELPAGALPSSGVKIELSRSIAGTLFEGLEYLTGFPYGCVEQTMSRALPNAVVGRALFQLGITNPTFQADLPAKVNAGLQRLYGYQHNDGGWGWWYDDSSHDYQTAWVIFGLAVMEDAGYQVDASVIERGVSWLNENLAGMDIRTRAYALYAMAAAGEPNIDETIALTAKVDTLDTFSQAGLALALHTIGRNAEARQIVDYLAETAVISEDTVYWAGENYDGAYYQKTMASATRSTALALSAFTQIQPGHELEPGIVRWLMGQKRQQGWGTTNETSYAILGLTDHLLATSFSEAAASTSYQLFLNDTLIASGSLGRGEPAASLSIPFEELTTGLNRLRITQSGGNRLYYAINSRVYLAQEKIDAAGDVKIRRVYIDPETSREIRQFQAGQLVKVSLTINMPERASYVLLEDSLPGGLEALNEGLNSSSHVAAAAAEPHYYWQEYGYNYKEIRGDRVSFFITEMDSGSRTITYFARATHAGSFVAMPAELSAMYDLSVWGRSRSASLTITD